MIAGIEVVTQNGHSPPPTPPRRRDRPMMKRERPLSLYDDRLSNDAMVVDRVTSTVIINDACRSIPEETVTPTSDVTHADMPTKEETKEATNEAKKEEKKAKAVKLDNSVFVRSRRNGEKVLIESECWDKGTKGYKPGLLWTREYASTGNLSGLALNNSRSQLNLAISSEQLGNSRSSRLDLTSQKALDPAEKVPKGRQKRFRSIFPDIDEAEPVLQSYHCALYSDILLQGFLYVTQSWFCFHSKLMGKKRLRIPVHLITKITKKKTAIVIPNAIAIFTEKEKFLFCSLLHRDDTYELLHAVWQDVKQNGGELDVSQENGAGSRPPMQKKGSIGTNSTDDNSSTENFGMHQDASNNSSNSSHPPHSIRGGDCSMNAPSPAGGTKDGRPEPLSAGDRSLESDVSFKGPLSFWKEKMSWLLRLPRTFQILAISAVLIVFLLCSAVLLAQKLAHLQAQLKYGTAYPASAPGSALHTDMLQRDSYHQGIEPPDVAIRRINSILESHINMLDQINEAVKGLQQFALQSCTANPAFDGTICSLLSKTADSQK